MQRTVIATLVLILVGGAGAQVPELELDPDDAVDEELRPAITAYREGRLDEAEALFVDYLYEAPEGEDPPSAPEAYFYLGLIEEHRGKLDQAEIFYEAALDLRKDYQEALTALGVLMSIRGDYDEARRKLERSLELNPSSPITLANLGHVYLEQEECGPAESKLRLALELKPDYVFARLGLGFILMTRERYQQAVEEFRYVLALEPDNFEAHANLADLLAQRRDYGDAYEHYRFVLDEDPDDFVALQNLGNIYAIIGVYDEAEDYLEDAEELRPDSERVQLLLDYVRRKMAEGPPPGPVVSQVTLDGNAGDEREPILEAFGLRAGDRYSETAVNLGVERIREFFAGRPIGGVDVNVRTTKQFDELAVAVELEVVTGGASTISVIELRGLVDTPTGVVEPILEEHGIYIGAEYDTNELFAAIRELYDTELFNSVSRNLRPGAETGQIELIILFEEVR